MIHFKIRYKLNCVIFFIIFMLISLMSTDLLHAQMNDLGTDFYYNRSISIQKSGMFVLAGWATANIFTGTFGYYHSSGRARYFHQMNSAWNLVNFGIAAFGYYGLVNSGADLTTAEILAESLKFDRILLINAGLDLLYIGTGTYLWKRGKNNSSDRMLGYGKSIVLQGTFLLVFDSILYLIHTPVSNKLLKINDQLSFTGNGFRIAF